MELVLQTDHPKFQLRNILEVFGIGCQQRQLSLHRLRGQPEILNAEVRPTPRLRQLRSQFAENLGRFTSNAKQRLTAHSAQHGHRTMALLRIAHEFDAKADFCQIHRRDEDWFLPSDSVDVGGADSATLNGDPQAGVNQEAHGFRSAAKVEFLPLRVPLIALESDSAVSSSSVR